MKKNIMSEEAFNELIDGFEYVNNLTDYGRKNIKYHVQKLQQENKQLKDNWIKLKDFIAKEYYMHLPLEASTKSITILIDKMQELEENKNE